jgi:hypothetical protein
MRSPSVSVRFARAVLRHTVTRGLDPVSLLRKNRISPRLLLEDDARISVERFADLQVSTMLALGDESLGYALRPVPIGCWSMMCHAVIGSSTLGQALHRFCRFYQLFDSGLHPVMAVDGESTALELAERGPPDQGAAYHHELLLSNAHRIRPARDPLNTATYSWAGPCTSTDRAPGSFSPLPCWSARYSRTKLRCATSCATLRCSC